MSKMTTETNRFETTEPLMRPHQVREHEEDLRATKKMLSAPEFIRGQLASVGDARKRMVKTEKMLEEQAPKPYAAVQKDAAVKREKELRDRIVPAMQSDKEMRHNPAGAVDRLLRFERRFKKDINEWKNIRLRLNADASVDGLADEVDVANLEQYRPRESSQDLNMHDPQVPVTDYHYGDVRPGTVVFDDDELALLGQVSPGVQSRLALMTNEERQQIMDLVQLVSADLREKETAPPPPIDTPEIEDISGMPWNDLQVFAKQVGLPIGTKGCSSRKEVEAAVTKRLQDSQAPEEG